jgi:hypothetical protein
MVGSTTLRWQALSPYQILGGALDSASGPFGHFGDPLGQNGEMICPFYGATATTRASFAGRIAGPS